MSCIAPAGFLSTSLSLCWPSGSGSADEYKCHLMSHQLCKEKSGEGEAEREGKRILLLLFLPTLLLTRFDWYGIRSYSIKRRFTLHRFLLKSLKTFKLFIDVCSNLHLAKEDCVCVCERECSGGWLVLPQRLEELVFHAHLFTCLSSLMGFSRGGWIGLKVATRRWNCIAVAQRARASSARKIRQNPTAVFPLAPKREGKNVQAHIQ